MSNIEPHLSMQGDAFVASTAVVQGDVTLGPEVSVWYGAVIRGDCAAITIGARTNVQDNAVIHADTDVPNDIGAGITIGHAAIVHGRRVGDDTLIGIGAIILGGAEVGAGCIIAAGTVVKENAKIPDGSLVAGVPGRIIRNLSEDDMARIREHAGHYIEIARSHLQA